MQRTAPLTRVTLALALLLAGCGSEPAIPEGTASESPAPQVAAKTPDMLVAPAGPADGRSEKVSNDLYEFEYSYPPVVGGIPDLKAELDKQLDASRTSLETEAKADQAEAAKNDYPYRPHSAGTEWKVVTDLPGWLSLSAERYTYSGGAHGMTFFDGLVWDKQAARVLRPIDLFIGKPALSKAIRTRFCDLLDKERQKRRGEPVDRDNGDDFNACIDPAESTLIFGSSNGRSFDRIGVLVEPYAAGSYAEGTFEITLPVTQAVIAAVKPEYKEAFSARQ